MEKDGRKSICCARVRFLGKNGHDWELEEAKKILTVGEVYEVSRIHIGDFSSKIWLRDCYNDFESNPAYGFNSVMFEGVEGSEL